LNPSKTRRPPEFNQDISPEDIRPEIFLRRKIFLGRHRTIATSDNSEDVVRFHGETAKALS